MSQSMTVKIRFQGNTGGRRCLTAPNVTTTISLTA